MIMKAGAFNPIVVISISNNIKSDGMGNSSSTKEDIYKHTDIPRHHTEESDVRI